MAQTFFVKKGDKFLIEIEMVKDMDLMADSEIMKSMYSKKGEEGISGEFKINTLHFVQSSEELEDKLKDFVNQAVIKFNT
jgi:hypothetical protein